MDSDSDDSFEKDFESLKRACRLTDYDNSTADRIQPPPSSADEPCRAGTVNASEDDEDEESAGEESHDIHLLQSIQDRFLIPAGVVEPFKRRASPTRYPDFSDSDDCDDDYETLRAIQRRFAAYDDGREKNVSADVFQGPAQVGAPILESIKDNSNSSDERSNAGEGFVNCVDTGKTMPEKEGCDGSSGQTFEIVEWDSLAVDIWGLELKNSHFPDSAQTFFDAIKKNRSYQRVIRSKMIQMESRIEELRKLRERVKILKDFQVACKKKTARALSQKKDDRVQLICKREIRENLKLNEKKASIMYSGPVENPHVASYRKTMMTFGVSICRENWSKKERENLVKGVKQQFQGMLLQQSVDLLGEEDVPDNQCNMDSLMSCIKDVDLTPERIRAFLPKVHWEQLATMYVPGRTGEECQSRFINFEDSLINHGEWTVTEDKNLLHIIQQKGLGNWIEIASSLGTKRTPFQCLARYQRSLNASILKREWTKEEDDQLRSAVSNFGEGNWQLAAAEIEGRTGTQCANRWLKTLHPARKRAGKWTAEENKRLKVAATLFGPKSWRKVATYVPGRTHAQCRERWVNCLDPSVNQAEWSAEEDFKLEEAISEHGYCWCKVAACVPRRTDNQCLRRWKALHPGDVPRLQEARKVLKAALISNFVDRETERPALGPTDFVLSRTLAISSKCTEPSKTKKRKSRTTKAKDSAEKGDLSNDNWSKEAEVVSDRGNVPFPTNIRRKRSVSRKKNSEPSCNNSLCDPDMHLLETPIADGMASSAGEFNGLRKLQPRKRRPDAKSKSGVGDPLSDAVPLWEIMLESDPKDAEKTEGNTSLVSIQVNGSDSEALALDHSIFGGGDDSLASFLLQNGRHSSEVGVLESPGDDAEAAEVEDNTILAHFCRKIKRRKRSTASSATCL